MHQVCFSSVNRGKSRRYNRTQLKITRVSIIRHYRRIVWSMKQHVVNKSDRLSITHRVFSLGSNLYRKKKRKKKDGKELHMCRSRYTLSYNILSINQTNIHEYCIEFEFQSHDEKRLTATSLWLYPC